MNILFYTFQEGHLVSDKEFNRLKKGFSKVGMNLIRWHKSKGEYIEPHDIVLVKSWSHTYEELPKNVPIVCQSIGSEWKVGVSPETNEPIRELYEKANAVVHVAEACKESMRAIFGGRDNEYVIIPAEEPKLPEQYNNKPRQLKLATTCIPRPVKRTDQLEELCKKYDIELVPAWGSQEDFSYYHNCDGYINISRKEGMPNTVLEALAYGLPCIVSNYGGGKEAVGDAGIVIKTDPDNVAWDPNDIKPIDEILFANAIKEFKSKLPELRIKARERVLSELNDYICACKFKEVFQTL